MKKSIKGTVLNTVVILGIIFTLIVLAGVPFIAAAFFKSSEFGGLHPYEWEITVFSVYACAVPFVIALFKLKKVCSLLFTQEAFSQKVAGKLRTIGICAFVEAGVFLAVQIVAGITLGLYQLLALYYIPCAVVLFICIALGFLLLVISDVFKKAAEIKEENDLTF